MKLEQKYVLQFIPTKLAYKMWIDGQPKTNTIKRVDLLQRIFQLNCSQFNGQRGKTIKNLMSEQDNKEPYVSAFNFHGN